jgi:hypothetical protein
VEPLTVFAPDEDPAAVGVLVHGRDTVLLTADEAETLAGQLLAEARIARAAATEED